MPRIRYQVACSLDGFIAAPDGGYDWIPMDPEIDFQAIFDQFDTLLMGRITYEVTQTGGNATPDKRVVVLSRSLKQQEHPGVTVIGTDVERQVEALRREAKKDIWLFGGGETFRRLLTAGLVDTVEPAVVPILLGGGVPLLPTPAVRAMLSLKSHRAYKSGIVLLEYEVKKAGRAG